MDYVKKYDPGRIIPDLPYANYFYELPLFSLGDARGRFDVSFVFNYALSTDNVNSFDFKPGYKLKFEKKILFKADVPDALQEAYGKKISIEELEEGGIYFVRDDSQRILIPKSSHYSLEYPDGSKDLFDFSGKIIASDDKYGNRIVCYNYDEETQRLESISCFSNEVTFEYNADNRVKSLCHDGKKTEFIYTNLGINVCFCTGETVELEEFEFNFDATAGTSDSTSSPGYKKGVRITNTGGVVRISDIVYGAPTLTEVNYNEYRFPLEYNELETDRAYSQVEITDFNGAKNRIQYYEDKPQYSYEVLGDDVSFMEWGELYRFTGSVKMLQHNEENNSFNVVGQQLLRDGCSMRKTTPNSNNCWENEDDPEATSKNYVISGWARAEITDNTLLDDISNATVIVSDSTSDLSPNKYAINLNLKPVGQWVYFSASIYAPWAKIYLYPLSNPDKIIFRDLRLTYQETTIGENQAEGDIHFSIIEDGLLHKNGEFISLANCEFQYNGLPSTGYMNVYFDDLVRNRINYKKGDHTTLFFCGRAQDAVFISGVNSVSIRKKDENEDEDAWIPFSEFYPAKRRYVKECGELITRIVDDDEAAFIIIETLNNSGAVISSQTLDSKLNTISSTLDGVTIEYVRDNIYGRVTSESVSCEHGELYERTINYNANNSVISKTDEFGKTTVYTYNSKCGVLESVSLPDNKGVVINEYDGSLTSLTGITFGEVDGRAVSFSRADACSYSMRMGNLIYNSNYSILSRADESGVYKKRESVAVTSGDVSSEVGIAEYHKLDSSDIVYYPSESVASSGFTTNYDKYGRITSISGLLSNEYDIISKFDSSTGSRISSENNSDALPVTSTDHIRSRVYRYEYDYDNRLIRKTVTGTDYSQKVSCDEFAYDDLDRLVSQSCTYDVTGGNSVSGVIEYHMGTNHPLADHTVKKYTYKLNGVAKAVTSNTLDCFKRVTEKSTAISGATFRREFAFNRTRLSAIDEYFGETRIGRFSHTYDGIGRITIQTYTTDAGKNTLYNYDTYGQLIKEENPLYGKTFTYSYDNVGNITSVKEYAYGADVSTASPLSTKTFTYSTTPADKLTSFNGNSISYNSYGCVSSYQGSTYSWERKQLKSIVRGNPRMLTGDYEYCAFTYNAYGQRVSKNYIYDTQMTTIGDAKPTYNTTYKYDNAGRLVYEYCSETYKSSGATHSHKLVYLYDDVGVIGVMYGYDSSALTPYYYHRNLSGDVVAILDTAGNKVVEYAYDAYGNCKVLDSTTNYTLGNYNPIRYRGYYYDRETKLYYLNSRYYNPEWRRFISPDDTSYLDPDSVNGLNLYCYCGNDPVNRYDPTGYSWEWSTFWKGFGMLVTSVGAIALSVTTFGAGIPLAMAAVAGATLGAGVLTGINGVATMIDAGADYNFVRDGLFNHVFGLSDSSYNVYSGVTEGLAAIGSIALGVYHTTGQYKAARASQKYLGKGYIKADKNRWVSQDGFRQVRWDITHHIRDGKVTPVHFNWYEFQYPISKGVRNEIIKDIHVWLKWFSYYI